MLTPSHTCNNPRAGNVFFPINSKSRQLGKLQKRRSGIEQPIDPIARQQLSARGVAIASARIASQDDASDVSLEFVDESFHATEIVRVVGIVELHRTPDGHRLGNRIERAT